MASHRTRSHLPSSPPRTHRTQIHTHRPERRGLTPRPPPPPPPAEEVQPLPPAAMTPHLARSGGPGACDSSGSLRPHLHLTPRTRPSAGRPPACRACTRNRGRAPLRVGEGRRGRSSRRREQRTALSRDPARAPDPRWALQDPRRRPESSGSAAGRVSTISRQRRRAPGGEGKGEESDPRSRPSPPREGAQRGGAGARAQARARESPPAGRARRHSGGGRGGRPSQRGRAGRSSNCLSPGSLPRPERLGAGRPKGWRRQGKVLTYTVNELVAPRV